MPQYRNKSLPDVKSWQPVSKNNDTFKHALEITCQVAQNRITSRAQAEARFSIFNFDSGSGVEDIVREEIASLLPARYSVDAGVVNDRHGNTAGDCDLVIRDQTWSPVIKPGATSSSRRSHFPIEGIYSAVEIKQTLGFRELDEAMKKTSCACEARTSRQPLWSYNREPESDVHWEAWRNTKSSSYQCTCDGPTRWLDFQ